jgi:hypothetical protein
MARIVTGHVEAHEKLTAKLLWRQRGRRGYVEAGNVREYADASSRSLVTRFSTKQGTRYVDAEVPDLCHEAWTFLLDENVREQEELLRLARTLSENVQRAAESATATLESVEVDRWFEIGSYNVARVRVSASLAGPLEEGTDYELNWRAGRIKVLDGGSVGEGEDLVLTFDRPSITFERRTTQQQALFHGDFVLEEYNQFSKLWLRRYAFEGYINVSEFPQHTGEFASYRAKVTARGPVMVDKRPTAASLDDVSAPILASPGDSSSSSSLSSSSSMSSRSSYSSSSESERSTFDPATSASSSSSTALENATSSSSSSSSSSTATSGSMTSEGQVQSDVEDSNSL